MTMKFFFVTFVKNFVFFAVKNKNLTTNDTEKIIHEGHKDQTNKLPFFFNKNNQ